MTADVAVIIPFTSTCPHRLAARDWVLARFAQRFPDWPVIVGRTDVAGFSRTQAILDGVAQLDARAYVVTDADVWTEGLPAAVDAVRSSGWAIPHLMIHRLSPESTSRVLAGEDWRGLPLSTDNAQDRRPYRGNETGTLVVVRRDVLELAPPDPRFVGWGQEDVAWAIALRCLVGAPWRGDADLMHLWHPPEPRMSRVTGSREGQALAQRYQRAARNPETMRALIDEARCAA